MATPRHALAALVLGLATGGLPGQVRIVPLGDSITESNPAHSSYRFHLWKMLDQADICADFIGIQFGVANGLPQNEDFDQQHDGFSGAMATVVDFHMSLAPWLVPNADIALIHLGSNDILGPLLVGQPVNLPSAEAALVSIIGRLRVQNPQVKVALARIMPIDVPTATAFVNTFNTVHLPSVVALTNQPGSPVVLVDQNSGFDFTLHYQFLAPGVLDPVHPNDLGEAILARNWFGAMVQQNWISAGTACLQTLAPGCAGGAPTGAPVLAAAPAGSLPVFNTGITFEVSNVPAGTNLVVGVVGLSEAGPFTPVFNCRVHPSLDLVQAWPVSPATGLPTFSLPLPSSVFLMGTNLYVQASTFGSSPTDAPTTNGLQLIVGL